MTVTNMYLFIVVICGIVSMEFAQKVPMTKPDGSLDLTGVLSHVTLLEQTVANFKTRTEQMELELQSTKQELEVTKTELQQSLNQLTKTVAMKTHHVAFNVYRIHAIITGVNVPLKYDTVHYNTSNVYDTTTGKFTAPVSGTYTFSAQVQMYKEHTAQSTSLHIVQSGNIISEGYGKTSEANDNMSILVTVVTYVSQGEQVWVVTNKAVQIIPGFYSPHASHFVGALLSED